MKMKYFIISALCVYASVAADKIVPAQGSYKNEGRIISGTPATVGQFPWHVVIRSVRNGETTYCGGSLINNNTILTAAHCIEGASLCRLYIGGITLNQIEVGRLYVEATKTVLHPRWDPITLNYDAGVIKLDSPITFNSRIRPVRLPPPRNGLQSGVDVIISGFGTTAEDESILSNVLLWTNLTSITNFECQAYYGTSVLAPTLCARGRYDRAPCHGDGGGALVELEEDGIATQHGVFIFSHVQGCLYDSVASGYVRTEYLLEWIDELANAPDTEDTDPDNPNDNGHAVTLTTSKFLLVPILILKIILN